MTLAETLPAKLGNAATSTPRTLEFQDEGWSLTLHTDRVETLGSAYRSIELNRLQSAPDGASYKTWAQAVANRVTGLLEPLKVLELDDSRQEALLRSDGPTASGDDRYYYEVNIIGTSKATVRRYKGNMTGTPRVEQPFALTHEVLAKLVNDFTT